MGFHTLDVRRFRLDLGIDLVEFRARFGAGGIAQFVVVHLDDERLRLVVQAGAFLTGGFDLGLHVRSPFFWSKKRPLAGPGSHHAQGADVLSGRPWTAPVGAQDPRPVETG